ncbi:FAD-dependent monooxygenase [Nocardia alni]|uniref:FAD-dependent monooxygenase n=1 Tax=Nocardia alni TaxID=2815723 RepID=UPI001C235B40|nr:FAD-dependent monooxygenase [Nocardia alni]
MDNEQILISGAGIAGLTTAYWLSRFGFRPTVVEQAPGLRQGGQGVDVREQAIEVIERMGIWPRVQAAAADVRGMRFVDADGACVGSIDMQRIKDKYGSAEVEIMRGDLVRLLHETTGDDVEYRFGDAIRSFDQDQTGVTAEFEHGHRQRFDLVIGADGLHSAVRRLAFGPEQSVVRHLNYYGAFGDADPGLGPDGWVTQYNTPGVMAGIYRSRTHARAKALFAFRSPRLDFDSRDTAAARDILAAHFGDNTAWHVAQLLQSALADPDLYVDALAQVRMPSWSSGRVALVGDAAYCAAPVSGAGAQLALLGAYRLAGELAQAGGDHRTGFAAYERTHRPLVTGKQRIGPNLRLLAPKTRVGITVRNTLTRLPVLESLGGMERIMAPGTTVPLPEYRSDHAGSAQ